MKFSEHWLRTMADPALDSPALAEALTMAGLEVEAREPAGPALDDVVVARILSVVAHPNADRLRVCSVDAGSGSPVTVVCGAPNAAVGMHAPLARPGARLPNGTAIAESTVSEKSNTDTSEPAARPSMICSPARFAWSRREVPPSIRPML